MRRQERKKKGKHSFDGFLLIVFTFKNDFNHFDVIDSDIYLTTCNPPLIGFPMFLPAAKSKILKKGKHFLFLNN